MGGDEAGREWDGLRARWGGVRVQLVDVVRRLSYEARALPLVERAAIVRLCDEADKLEATADRVEQALDRVESQREEERQPVDVDEVARRLAAVEAVIGDASASPSLAVRLAAVEAAAAVWIPVAAADVERRRAAADAAVERVSREEVEAFLDEGRDADDE